MEKDKSILERLKNSSKRETFIPKTSKRSWWRKLLFPHARPMTDRELRKEKMRFRVFAN